jgi:hypothetical protein
MRCTKKEFCTIQLVFHILTRWVYIFTYNVKQKLLTTNLIYLYSPQNLSAEKDGLDIIQHEWALPKFEQRAEAVLKKLVSWTSATSASCQMGLCSTRLPCSFMDSYWSFACSLSVRWLTIIRTSESIIVAFRLNSNFITTIGEIFHTAGGNIILSL